MIHGKRKRGGETTATQAEPVSAWWLNLKTQIFRESKHKTGSTAHWTASPSPWNPSKTSAGSFTASGAGVSEPKVSQAANKSHIPPNMKVNKLLCSYSHLKRIRLTLEVKEEKKKHVTARVHPMNSVTSMNVRTIHLKIPIFSLKTNKNPNKRGTLKSL